jgi:cytoskeleton protein RodZ
MRDRLRKRGAVLRPVPKEQRDEDRVFHLGGAFGGRGEPPVEGPQPNLRPVISPSSVGATLSITREKFGQELRQVAQTLRIKQGYLEAIEDDRYGDLPGLTYAVGFVRSYADYLGLDSKLLVERYKQEAQGLNRKSQLVFPTPAAEAKVPTGAIILMALILVAFTYLGWTYFSDDAQPPAVAGAPVEPKAAEPKATAPATPAPAATAGGNATGTTVPGTTATGTTATGTTPATAPAPGLPAPAPAAADSNTAVAEAEAATTTAQPDATAAVASEAPAPAPGPGAAAAADNVAAVPAAPPAPAAATTESAPVATQTALAPPLPPAVELAHQPRLVIRAAQDSWVQIRNAKDEAVLTKVLREGESYEVPEEPGLVLLTGNAGGLTLVLDGKALPSLGPVGSVRRNIALDPELLSAP